MTATQIIKAAPVHFTDDDRQILIRAALSFPEGYLMEFERCDNDDEYALLVPNYPDALACHIVAHTRDGHVAVTDCVSGRTLNTPSLADGINLIGRLVTMERA